MKQENDVVKFITNENNDVQPTFDMVRNDQFFVDANGWIAQKLNSSFYFTIADPDGIPASIYHDDAKPKMKITRVLPTVTKIEF